MEIKELQAKYGISDEDLKILLEIYKAETLREAYSNAGKKGGAANLKKGKEYFSRIGKLGLAKRYSRSRKDKGIGRINGK